MLSLLNKRKLAQKELEQERDFITAVMDTVASLVVVLDLEGRIVRFNRTGEKVTGYKFAEVLGKPFWDVLLAPEEVKYVKAVFDKLHESNLPSEHENYLITKDGRKRLICWNNTVLSDAQGQPEYIIGTGLDITDKKHAERELSESLNILRAIIEGTSDAIFVKDLEGRYLLINETGARFQGKSASEIIGKRDMELYPPETARRFIEHDRKVISTGETQTFEGIATGPGIEQVYLVTKGVYRDSAGRVIGLIGISHDITERKHYEAALEEEKTRYRLLFESNPQPIWVFDLETLRFLAVNEAAVEHYGYSHQEFLSMTIKDIRPSEDVPALIDNVSHVTSGVNKAGVWRHRKKDGTVIDVEITAHTLIFGGRRAELVLANDITERTRAEEERIKLIREQQARKDAEEANRLKDEFLTTLSHELRTPLTSILGWSQLLNTGQLDEQSRERALETIERNALAQRQLIDDLLDVSRIITGKLRLDAYPTKLAPIVEAAVDAVQPTADAKGIKIHAMVELQNGAILGDPDRLQQIIWNLLSNAIKFTPQGGRVEVELTRADSQAQITVKDTGQGIAVEFLPYVFERFRQADSSSTRTYSGLGLGLALVRHLVELHGGSVFAQSEGEGGGATFIVRLPLMLHKERVEAGHEHSMSEHFITNHRGQLEGLRVLVVDDDTDACELMALALRKCGADVRTADSAAGAFDTISRWLPDSIVSDIGMPGEDGYDLIRQIRALRPEQGGKVPALALTAYARDEDRDLALAAGFQMHVGKPVELVELVEAVAGLAGRAKKV
ncbi:MAG: PAS domain S-box protein [Pyrinomonadaceae bacterium]